MIYCDPDDSATYTGLAKADLILVTHSHSDHFSATTIDAVRGPNAVIIAPQDVYNQLTVPQRAITRVLGYGNSTNLLGLTVEAVPAYNTNHTQEELYFGDETVEAPGCDRGHQGNIGMGDLLSVRVAQGELAKSEPGRTEEPRKPYFTADGTLRIPFDSDPKYHWWKGGQSVKKTIAELRGEPVEEAVAEDVASDCNY
jgi:hypothetical protein